MKPYLTPAIPGEPWRRRQRREQAALQELKRKRRKRKVEPYAGTF